MKNYLNESLSAQERAEALVNEMTVEEAASNIAARPIACGNMVATPLRASPWIPSFHQL